MDWRMLLFLSILLEPCPAPEANYFIPNLQGKMKNTIQLVMVLAVGLMLSSCKKENTAKTLPPPIPITETGPYLYVGGSTYINGLYWKISLYQNLGNPAPDTVANSRNISAILTSGEDVYMAGQTGGYFKNDSFVAITGASNIQYIALSGIGLYATGFDNFGNLAYWQNNSEVNLENTIGRNLFPYEATSVYGITGLALSSQNQNVLISGSLFFENEPFTPDSAAQGNFGLLWNNGGLSVYGPGALVSATFSPTAGVSAVGSDVYVAGTFPSGADRADSGGYWKNGVWNSINNGSFHPSSIASFGSDVYIPGSTYTLTPTWSQQAAYWKNGTLVQLNGAAATAITVYGSDIYVLGVDQNNNNVVWKNGALFETLGSAGTSLATCLAIGQ